MSCTRTGIRSGYWTVYGLRMKCDAVTAMPSKMLVTASFILVTYSETAPINSLYIVGLKYTSIRERRR